VQLYWLVFIAGLTGGFGHCIGMCGSLSAACSYAAVSSKNKNSIFQTFFQLGRVSSYALTGLFLGFLGSLPMYAKMTSSYRQWIPAVIGVVMVIIAFSLGFYGKNIGIDYKINNNFLFKKIAVFAKNSKNSAFPFGFLMGFIPCGLTLAIGLKAVSTGSAVLGCLVMTIFAIGTIPALLSFGLLGGFLSNKSNMFFLRLGALTIGVMGLLMIYNSFNSIFGHGMKM
jgi:sulfite exporter TauE/SafE